jgi:hypothetical protein
MKKRSIAMTSLVLLVAATAAMAQSSASYRLEESVFNAGGHPSQGMTMSSASFRISMDSVGEGIVAMNLASASYGMDSGFGPAYRPPGIIEGLHFVATDTMLWDADPAAGSYNVYRDKLVYIDNYGTCFRQGLVSARAVDTEIPDKEVTFFYLVTAVNRLDEEGGKGSDSDGATREGNWCP